MTSPAVTELISNLITRVRGGSDRALGRILSLIEDGGPSSAAVLEQLYPFSGRAYVIGVTGSPGAGKSTLVDHLVGALAHTGKRVGVLAVDPTSPFTGGALLGDRIRMTRAGDLSGTFVRSMASRGALGGIAPRTPEAISAYDAAGFDYVIIETVGVGQGEVEIVRTADTVIVVLVPGMGDVVQAMKAGILEIADVFALNKADYEGIDRLQREITTMLALADHPEWSPPLVRTVASDGIGIEELRSSVELHRKWGEERGEKERRRRVFLEQSLLRHVSERAGERVLTETKSSGSFQQVLTEVFARVTGPIAGAERLVAECMPPIP